MYFKSPVSDRAPTILSHDPPPTFRQKHVDTAGFGCQPGRRKISGNGVIGLGPSISVHVKELVRVVGSTTQIIYQFKMANSNLILEQGVAKCLATLQFPHGVKMLLSQTWGSMTHATTPSHLAFGRSRRCDVSNCSGTPRSQGQNDKEEVVQDVELAGSVGLASAPPQRCNNTTSVDGLVPTGSGSRTGLGLVS